MICGMPHELGGKLPGVLPGWFVQLARMSAERRRSRFIKCLFCLLFFILLLFIHGLGAFGEFKEDRLAFLPTIFEKR